MEFIKGTDLHTYFVSAKFKTFSNTSNAAVHGEERKIWQLLPLFFLYFVIIRTYFRTCKHRIFRRKKITKTRTRHSCAISWKRRLSLLMLFWQLVSWIRLSKLTTELLYAMQIIKITSSLLLNNFCLLCVIQKLLRKSRKLSLCFCFTLLWKVQTVINWMQ